MNHEANAINDNFPTPSQASEQFDNDLLYVRGRINQVFHIPLIGDAKLDVVINHCYTIPSVKDFIGMSKNANDLGYVTRKAIVKGFIKAAITNYIERK